MFAYWKIFAFVVIFGGVAYFIFPRGHKLTEMYMKSYQWEEAFKLIEEKFKKNPHDPRVIKNMARYLEVKGDRAQELKLYEKLVELRPHNPKYRSRLAQLYRWSNRVEDEFTQLEEMAKLSPKDSETHARLVDFYHWYKKLDRAIPHHLKLIELEPKNPDHIVALADTYMHLKEVTKGISAYEKLVQKFPKNPDYHFMLADVYEWRERLDEALQEYLAYLDLRFPRLAVSQAIFKRPVQFKEPFSEKDWDVLERLILIKTEQKKIKEVEQLFESLETSFPKEKNFWIEKRAKFYVATEQVNRALALYRTLVQKDPDSLWAQEGLAQTALWVNRLEEARKAYQKLIQRYPDKEEYQRALGLIYFWSSSFDKAKFYLEPYFRKYPNDKQVKAAVAQMDREARVGLLSILFSKKEYFKANRLAKDLKDTYSLWVKQEIKKQTALKAQTHYRAIQTIDKKSTRGEYTYEMEGGVSKYLGDRWQGKGRYQYATVKDTALAPLLTDTISMVGFGAEYDLTSRLKVGLEPQLYHTSLWTTVGSSGEVQWVATDSLYVDGSAFIHKLWTNPVDAVKFKGVQDGGELYFDYKLFKRLNLIGSGGWSRYSVEGGNGKGWVGIGTFKPLFALWLNPKVEVGYFFDFQHASQNQRLAATVPLIRRIAAHYLMGQLDFRPWNRFRIFMNGAIGEDTERQLTLDEGALFTYLFKGEWQISDRLFFEGLYSYSSQSSKTASDIQAVALGQLSYSFH